MKLAGQLRERPLLCWLLAAVAVAVLSALFAGVVAETPALALWPSLVALAAVVLSRQAFASLLLGAWAGALLLTGGNPLQACVDLALEHLLFTLLPSFEGADAGEAVWRVVSSWKLGALGFTLLLGGFAALLEGGGGLRVLLLRLMGDNAVAPRRFQFATMALGLLCFFDGLANSVLLGRVTRSLAAAARTSRVKLAYIVDSTSSGVASVAVFSTWIATQVGLLQGELEQLDALERFTPFLVFLTSVPQNFYVWFTLLLLVLVLALRWTIGPMRRYEARLPEGEAGAGAAAEQPEAVAGVSVRSALIPLGVLVGAILLLFYLWEARPLWPVEVRKLTLAISSGAGAFILQVGALCGVAAAWLLFPKNALARGASRVRLFLGGVATLLPPLAVLIAAWMLSSTLSGLGAGAVIAEWLRGDVSPGALPLMVFLTGALTSFITGTSWGTMSLLMPLAVPAVFDLAGAEQVAVLLPAVVGAVFGGAVFGDHCSPFSDTTLVTSVACGVTPWEHVSTQMPYALIAACAAALFGFLPVGLGLYPVWAALLLGALALGALVTLTRTKPPA